VDHLANIAVLVIAAETRRLCRHALVHRQQAGARRGGAELLSKPSGPASY
jgi:hypothetical protein